MRKSLVPATVLAAVLAVVATGCGGGSSGDATASGKVNPEYADFCLTATELDKTSSATHGDDPEAMSDPAKMEAAWKTIIESSQKLFDEAPLPVKSDVKAMLDGMKAMDRIYASYKYNLGEMKAVPKVAEDLNAIANDASISEASKRFKSFMSTNCGL